MAARVPSRLASPFFAALALLCVVVSQSSFAQAQKEGWITLDHVVAVVNQTPILASDVALESRLSALDDGATPTSEAALDHLISRQLILEQSPVDAPRANEAMPSEVSVEVARIRRENPECIRDNCQADAGWLAFLQSRGLNAQKVENYLRLRVRILRFVEQRFRPGITVAPEEIKGYYQSQVAPKVATSDQQNSLEALSPRIEQILVEQHLNQLFSEWLDSLRARGDVEILDPAFAATQAKAPLEDSGVKR